MDLKFPPSFFFGTSTSAYQIETAFEHDWLGVKAKDGYVFDRTTDHERHIAEDVEIIASLAPNYRMSLMWSRLQRGPYLPFQADVVIEYHTLLTSLKQRNVDIMMVLFHWCNPQWFSTKGSWESKESIALFVDYALRVVDEFGSYVTYWNTFNEPNLYSTFSYGLGEFPPYTKDVFKSVTVVKNMAEAHERIVNYIRQKFPRALTGLSHNCVLFGAENMAGAMPAKMADYWYMEYLPGMFASSDYVGLSYYAKLSFDPFPISYLRTPEKFKDGRPHDEIWEYYPQGLREIVARFHTRFKKPIIITENGICTQDDTQREGSIRDYMTIIHALLEEGVDILGYYHWSAWDNFEWTLGPTYKFGLYDCHPETMKRTKKKSADLFSRLAYEKVITI